MENQATIHTWARATFGETGPLAVAARMNVEVAELILGLSALSGQGPGTELYAALTHNLELANNIAGGLAVADLRLDGVPSKAADRDALEGLLESARYECADVQVMLYQIAELLNADLGAYTTQKMERNRRRTWGRAANGMMQHTGEGI